MWKEWRQEKWREWRRGRRKGKGCSELRSVVRIRVDGWRLRAGIGVWREGGVYAWYLGRRVEGGRRSMERRG